MSLDDDVANKIKKSSRIVSSVFRSGAWRRGQHDLPHVESLEKSPAIDCRDRKRIGREQYNVDWSPGKLGR